MPGAQLEEKYLIIFLDVGGEGLSSGAQETPARLALTPSQALDPPHGTFTDLSPEALLHGTWKFGFPAGREKPPVRFLPPGWVVARGAKRKVKSPSLTLCSCAFISFSST